MDIMLDTMMRTGLSPREELGVRAIQALHLWHHEDRKPMSTNEALEVWHSLNAAGKYHAISVYRTEVCSG